MNNCESCGHRRQPGEGFYLCGGVYLCEGCWSCLDGESETVPVYDPADLFV